jgi:acid phosphatase
MKSIAPLAAAVLAELAQAAPRLPHEVRDVDETYPYVGPAVPVGDWVDPTINGNGRGFPRLVEAPAVKPATENPSNNINVIALAYIPNGVNVHYQTPFGLGEAPAVVWGSAPDSLASTASGSSHTYVP